MRMIKPKLKKLASKGYILAFLGVILFGGGGTAALFLSGFGGGTTSDLQDGLVGHWKLDKNPSSWLEGFEDNTLNDWTVHDTDFEIKTDNVYEGAYSAGIQTSSAPEDVAEVIPEGFEGGQKPDTFSFYWYEITNSSGGGLRLFDDAGNLVAGFASDNDQWTLNDGDGWTDVKGGTATYQVWTYVEFTFDWEGGTYDYYIERLSDSETRSGTRNLASSSGAETLMVSEHHNQTWGGHGAMHMWFDNIKFDYHSAKDDSPYDNHGTINGASPTSDRHSQTNAAHEFDGTDDYINSSYQDVATRTGAYSLSMWFKTTGTSDQSLWQNSGSCSDRNGMQTNGSWASFGYYDGTSFTRASGPINSGQWNHVVGINNGGTLSVYVNGEEYTGTDGGYIHCTNDYMYLGRTSSSSGPRFFNGKIDEVRLYDRIISSDEVSALYDSYNPGVQVASTQKDLVSHWKMDGNGNDATPYSNHGTVNGATPTTDRHGRSDSAYNFDGTNDIRGTNQPDIQTNPNLFTASGFISADNQDSGFFITPQSNGRDQYIAYDATNERLRVSVAESANTNTRQRYSTIGSVPLNTWTHWAVVINGTTIKIYINGELDQTYNESISIGGWENEWRIGQRGNDTNWLLGKLDDIRVYGRELDASEVRDLHDSYNPTVQVSDLQKNLKNNWSLNGDAKDKTPYAGHGTVNGATSVADRHGRADSAYDFDGTDDYIALDNFFDSVGALPEFTVSAWVKVNSGEGGWSVLGYDRSEYFTAAISRSTTDKVEFSTTDSSNNVHDMDGTIAVADGTWHHVVWQYDGMDKIIYVDGAEDTTVSNPHDGAAIGTGTTRYGFIGDGSEATSFDGSRNGIYFNGQIGNVRFYERALSSAEIQTLYQIYH